MVTYLRPFENRVANKAKIISAMEKRDTTPSSSTNERDLLGSLFLWAGWSRKQKCFSEDRAFRSSARRLARWRNGHRQFLSSPAPLGRPRVPPFFSTTKVAKIDPLFLFCHGRAIIIMSLRYIKQSFVMPVDGLIMVKDIF